MKAYRRLNRWVTIVVYDRLSKRPEWECMSGVQSNASDIDVDLGRLFASLATYWKRIAFVALAVTALALAFVTLATPHYRAETRVLIETRESVFTRPASGGENERPILDEEGIA